MKLGGRRKTSMGFTIVEVMIVLAVSSIILLSAITLVNGRQNQTEFTTGVNNLQQQLQQVINETASGYFPGVGGFTCQGAGGGPVTFSAGVNNQGTNQGCVFLGKAIQFGLGPTDDSLAVLPLAGRQYLSGGYTSISSVGQAQPRVAWPSAVGEPVSLESLSPISSLQYGLHIASYNSSCGVSGPPEAICYEPTSSPGTFTRTGVAAFMYGDASGTLASFNASTGNLSSGSEQLSLYGVYPGGPIGGGSQKGQARDTASSNIGNVPGTSIPPNPPGGPGMGWLQSASKVLICVASGSTNQSGLFIIGGGTTLSTSGDGGLSVTLQIKGDQTC
jgi:prepilin-type N-terminal cleavage/methylation domain-containing protein